MGQTVSHNVLVSKDQLIYKPDNPSHNSESTHGIEGAFKKLNFSILGVGDPNVVGFLEIAFANFKREYDLLTKIFSAIGLTEEKKDEQLLHGAQLFLRRFSEPLEVKILFDTRALDNSDVREIFGKVAEIDPKRFAKLLVAGSSRNWDEKIQTTNVDRAKTPFNFILGFLLPHVLVAVKAELKTFNVVLTN